VVTPLPEMSSLWGERPNHPVRRTRAAECVRLGSSAPDGPYR
jgi:hypothetical protein